MEAGEPAERAGETDSQPRSLRGLTGGRERSAIAPRHGSCVFAVGGSGLMRSTATLQIPPVLGKLRQTLT